MRFNPAPHLLSCTTVSVDDRVCAYLTLATGSLDDGAWNWWPLVNTVQIWWHSTDKFGEVQITSVCSVVSDGVLGYGAEIVV